MLDKCSNSQPQSHALLLWRLRRMYSSQCPLLPLVYDVHWQTLPCSLYFWSLVSLSLQPKPSHGLGDLSMRMIMAISFLPSPDLPIFYCHTLETPLGELVILNSSCLTTLDLLSLVCSDRYSWHLLRSLIRTWVPCIFYFPFVPPLPFHYPRSRYHFNHFLTSILKSLTPLSAHQVTLEKPQPSWNYI